MSINPVSLLLIAVTTVIGALFGHLLFGLLAGLLIVLIASVA